ncbi:hypothetical protein PAHAL_3G488700 [Panicum hallii]|uniref:Uncharacterized protein n=2 Tax=Panicum hallii TaxID=206008 RepID=A0A2S3HFQ7_9POAL|nr:hypothetical protein PAHAL_3G488700 [Panicum hallii]
MVTLINLVLKTGNAMEEICSRQGPCISPFISRTLLRPHNHMGPFLDPRSPGAMLSSGRPAGRPTGRTAGHGVPEDNAS